MTLATAALVATEHEARASRRAAYLYLVMSHLGTGFLIAGFLMLASVYGSLSFATLLSGGPAIEPISHILFAFFFLGFGVKAGIVPLHVWLPEAHPAAPTSISALMSGVLIKTGIYGLVRVCAFGLGVPRLSWGVIVLTVGGLSAVLGCALRADAARSQTTPRVPQHREYRDHSPGPWRRDDGALGRQERCRRGRVGGQSVSRAEPCGVQRSPGSRRRERRHGDRDAADRAARGPAAADALDRPVFSRRRDGDLRSAPAERLRQRVADIPVVPVRVPRLQPSRSCICSSPSVVRFWR